MYYDVTFQYLDRENMVQDWLYPKVLHSEIPSLLEDAMTSLFEGGEGQPLRVYLNLSSVR